MSSRYVVAGLAPPRTAWFDELASWATAGALPVEYVKCLSAAELSARLDSGRTFSALVVDGATTGLDRDLVDQARRAGAAVLVVDDGRGRDWSPLAPSAVLTRPVERSEVLAALEAHATPVTIRTTRPLRPVDAPPARALWTTVLGAGGSGTSTVALTIAGGLAHRDPAPDVLLADLSLHGDQAMFHDAVDAVPGLPELVESARTRRPAPEDVRGLVFAGDDFGYDLLLGLRRHRDWSSLRPGAVRHALHALRATYRWVVADTDADLEGEAQTGSIDIEERNVLARESAALADVVVVTARAEPAGIHRLARLVESLLDHEVATARILPVLTGSPRNPASRAALAHALGELIASDPRADALASPLHLGDRRRVDPTGFTAPRSRSRWATQLTTAVDAVLTRADTDPPTLSEVAPARVTPGSLGRWLDEEEAAG